jgi:hypothetical protein
MFKAIVDGRWTFTNSMLADVMAVVESKDVEVVAIWMDVETWRRLDREASEKPGEFWGKRVLLDGCILVVDERSA